MVLYFVKLLILLPLVGGMAYGALWLWRKYQPGLLGAQGDRAIRIVEMLPVGTFGKLAVVEFDGKRLLVSITRGRIEKLAEGHDGQAEGQGHSGYRTSFHDQLGRADRQGLGQPGPGQQGADRAPRY